MIFIILVFGLVIRLININQSLWLDEAISAIAAKNYTFTNIITVFSKGDTHPPLYYLILKSWASIFGYSEISLRIPSIIFGLATIFVVYKLCMRFTSHHSPVAALLLSTAPLHIYYSQEIRMYALTTLLVTLAVYFFLNNKWKQFSLSILFLGLTDYLPLLILPVFFIYGILKRESRDWWKRLTLSLIPLIIFLIFWLPSLLVQTQGTRSYLLDFQVWKQVLGKAGLKDLSLVWIKFIIGRISIEQKWQYGLVITLVSLPILYSLFISAKKLKANIIFWLWLIVPLVLALLGSIFIPGFSYFRLLFLLPAFYILITFGIGDSKNSSFIFYCLIIFNLIFSFVYLTNQNFWREDWRGAVSLVEAKIQTNERVLMSFPELFAPYRWYTNKINYAGVTKDFDPQLTNGVYTLDYLMDLTDPKRSFYSKLKSDHYKEQEIYNFRGVGQIRHWIKE